MTSNKSAFLTAWLASTHDPSTITAALVDLGRTRRVWAVSHQDDVFGVKDILERAATGLTVSMNMPGEARLMLVLRLAEKMADATNKEHWVRAIDFLHQHTRGVVKGAKARTVANRRRALAAAIVGKKKSCESLLHDSIIWALRSAVWADDLSVGQP